MTNTNKINDSNDNKLSSILTGNSSKASKKKRKKDEIAQEPTESASAAAETELLMSTSNTTTTNNQAGDKEAPSIVRHNSSSVHFTEDELGETRNMSHPKTSSSKAKPTSRGEGPENEQYDSDVFVNSNQNSPVRLAKQGSVKSSEKKSKSRCKLHSDSSFASSTALSSGKRLFGVPMLCCVYFASVYSLVSL